MRTRWRGRLSRRTAARPQKTPLDKQRVVRALNSTEPVPPDAGQGGLRGRAAALQPAGGGVWPTWAQHHPRGTRSCDKRRPGHSVGWRCWLVGEQGTHPDSQSRSLAGSRRRAGRGGARRCPGGAERRQAGRRHSARGPVSLGGRQQAAPLWRRGQLACPTSRCCCSNLRAGWAAGTLHVPQRPAATGISVSRPHCCATGARSLLPSSRRRDGCDARAVAIDRRPDRPIAIHTSPVVGSKLAQRAHARAPRCTARSTRAGRCAGCWRP